MDVFEAMGTCRAMRHLKPDPVPDELVQKVLWAATRAPSPGNSQGWDFIVVVDDPEPKGRIAGAIREAMAERVAAMPRPDRTTRLMLDGTARLIDTLDRAPVIIFVASPVIYPPAAPREQFTWSALYPAAQNILVAARAGHHLHHHAHDGRGPHPRRARPARAHPPGRHDRDGLARRPVRTGQPAAGRGLRPPQPVGGDKRA